MREGARPGGVYHRPYLYDLALGGKLGRQTDFLEGVFDRHADGHVGSVVEYGCGTARYLRALGERGYRTAGVDLSREMVEYGTAQSAEMHRPPALYVGDMARWTPPVRCDAAINMASTLRYLTENAQLRSHFRCAARALRPGGVYVLDLVLAEPRNRPMIHEEWVRRRAGYRAGLSLRGYEVDPVKRVEKVLFTIRAVRGDERLEAQGLEEHRLITADELEAFATADGLFHVEAVYGPRWDLRDRRHMRDGPGRRLVILKRTDREPTFTGPSCPQGPTSGAVRSHEWPG